MVFELLIKSLKNQNCPNYMLLEKDKMIQLLTKLKLNLPEEFLNKTRKEKYIKGNYLIRAGQVISKIWFLESGIAHSFFHKGKIKITQNFTFPNEIFSIYSSVIRKSPSILSIQFLTDSEVWSMDWEDYKKMSQCFPELVEAERLLVACSIYNALERLLNRFFTIKEQYYFLLKRQPGFIEQIPSVYLANYLGASPETISRVRSKIKDWEDIPDMLPQEYVFLKKRK